MFSNIKVGDRVWSMVYGWGIVNAVDQEDLQYPFRVVFTGGQEKWFTGCGREIINHLNPTLFWDEVKITPPAPPPTGLKTDTPILVRDSGGGEWVKRHFHSFGKDGRIRAWSSGYSSYTAINGNHYCAWDAWKLPED